MHRRIELANLRFDPFSKPTPLKFVPRRTKFKPSAIRHRLSAICHLPSAICHLLLAICYWLFARTVQTSAGTRLLPYFPFLPSFPSHSARPANACSPQAARPEQGSHQAAPGVRQQPVLKNVLPPVTAVHHACPAVALAKAGGKSLPDLRLAPCAAWPQADRPHSNVKDQMHGRI